ncbi:2-succinyl-5-enolpyruvyl-6-hydroxy-3-cyclohexene-1-carboxylic-acid synthase [Estrella lausannensis]|uniref:2-succinyl-5-enolpyruvyl-6-hydroxy-3-cyclohexene-1-carboxylate synthase n=1 Tax=Estrella lausannensis TaxID=483423 RepID=A0A0H5DNY0_9BACT|nr:2-succinyl-5-enolpyruvyl-6-hydroxy-3-cyclohexene-1-carboxylic-acid synthase [Estrella lausannensis]CRX38136.1 2-succinyl-5-enolpyruvyl-6-hydroxy-3-cyclohexene-1-carboxylate synthase [Estrella lausannensis]
MGRDTKQISIDRTDAQRLNEDLTFNLVQAMARIGIRHFCICPGGRNAGMIDLIAAEESFHIVSFHDERAAGFFAVGKIMATGEPCCVVTTSGTAVGELMPAVMEAYYSGLPLVVLSADRPKRFRGSGAPQTAEQERIFGLYTPHFEDLEAESEPLLHTWDLKKPCHINLCLEEAYEHDYSRFPDIRFESRQESSSLFREEHQEAVHAFIEKHEYPFAVAGALSPGEAAAVKRLLLHYQLPCLLEGHSRLRADKDLQHLFITYGDDALVKSAAFGYPIDGVLRLGGVPTSRLFRDTEFLEGKISLLSVSKNPFAGSSWGDLLHTDLSRFQSPHWRPEGGFAKKAQDWMERDRALLSKMEALYEKYPRAEQTLVHRLSKIIPLDSRLFLGNSLPIREWDLHATTASPLEEVYAVRGLNGIDGQISAFLGLLHPQKKNIALMGDLTALYDLNAFFALKDCHGAFTLFIINNGGGKLFRKLFKNPLIQNNHELGFAHWPRMFGLSYAKVETSIIGPELLQYAVVEIVPEQDQSDAFNVEMRP